MAAFTFLKKVPTLSLKAFLLSLVITSLVMPCYAGCFKDADGNTVCCDENGNCKKAQ
jgi:hypothetical protein